MRIRIGISVHLTDEQVAAFKLLQGEPTEKAMSEYILANGVKGLDLLVENHKSYKAFENQLPF